MAKRIKSDNSKIHETKLSQDDFENYIERKKELVIKDYESLFTVFGRQTTNIYNFRGWTIALLSAYIGFAYEKEFFTNKVVWAFFNFKIYVFFGYIIILIFFVHELSERVINSYLLDDLRKLEGIFMIKDKSEYQNAINNYVFRDIRDEKFLKWENIIYIILKVIKNMFNGKVIIWYSCLILLFSISSKYINFKEYKENSSKQKVIKNINVNQKNK